jgi:isoleucyl-tRNA synthetase
MDQWFLRLEGGNLRQRVLDFLGEVQWIPALGQNRLRSALESRPDWCISRQRSWGTPLPVFFNGAGKAHRDGTIIRAIADRVRRVGSDCWFTESAAELLADVPLPAGWDPADLRPGTDTLDVWLDSGCSFSAVLQGHSDLHFPADLYAEGSDQHRGWFQSSLWCSAIATGRPPYRAVLTHGFVVGEDRKKISKSADRPQSADAYVQRYGADVVRLWIASEDFRGDVPVSDAILEHIVAAYGTIRNTLRFQLGNLYDFDSARNGIPRDQLQPVDQWALGKLRQLLGEVTAAYDTHEFHRVYRAILNFCTVTLSAVYHDILKDRLYTLGANWPERRSAQTVLHEILSALLALLLPILPHTVDEAYAHLQENSDFAERSAHLLDWPGGEGWEGGEKITADIERLLAVRTAVNQKLEEARREKWIGKSLDACVTVKIGANSPDGALLRSYAAHLPELWIVSQVDLADGPGEALDISVGRARGERCARSWRWCEDLVEVGEWGRVSPRCRKVLLELFPNLA